MYNSTPSKYPVSLHLSRLLENFNNQRRSYNDIRNNLRNFFMKELKVLLFDNNFDLAQELIKLCPDDDLGSEMSSLLYNYKKNNT